MWQTIVDGPRAYDEGKTRLELAIREYDQAVFHLAARAVTDLKYQQDSAQKQRKDEELLQWLSGPFESPWLVEGQLSLFRRQRGENTLQWARDMPEFHKWRSSRVDQTPKDRFLWIRGTLGVGKSIMAAYFIDLLKCHYPNAIIAYFFCRSNQPGLTTARDIIRTLAYQCTEDDEAAHSILHKLKQKGFRISENQEVDFLCEKLLSEPLRGTRKEIYIIVDGVDEADMLTPDKFDRSGTPEMNVLLKSLAKLRSVRLLFISRATANICNILPNITVKTIDKSENAKDIKKYVEDFVAKSNQLHILFRNENKDPIRYFEEKADGIFLWVTLVIQQLERAKTQSQFRNYLEGFSAASGSMETLYESLLSRIDPEYVKWVKEIIRWLVVTERRLSVNDLKIVVEFCVADQFANFQEFLSVDCGSFLQLIPAPNVSDGVQLIHETFRSFLLKRDQCPPEFLIVEEETHGHVALSCMKRLSNVAISATINDYCSIFWVKHLSKATSLKQSNILLVNLHQFFTSAGLKTWIKGINPYFPSTIGLQVRIEEEALRHITDWLQKWVQTQGEETLNDVHGNMNTIKVEMAINWRRAILNDAHSLGELMGKAAANVWLYEVINDVGSVITCFRLALKYYWKSSNSTVTYLHELNELVKTEFIAISIWAEAQQEPDRIVTKNIALAFFALYKWDDCIRWFDADKRDENSKFQEVLGTAYMTKGDFNKAIDILEGAVASHPTDRLLRCLANAFAAKGNDEKAIDLLELAIEKGSSSYDIIRPLWTSYRRTANYDRAIKTFKFLIEKGLGSGPWVYLGRAYVKKSDINGLIAELEARVEKYPNEPRCFTCLGRLRKIDSDQLRQIVEVFNSRHSKDPFDLAILSSIHVANDDFDGAITVVESMMDRGLGGADFIWSKVLLNVCKKKGQYDKTVEVVEKAVENHPTQSELLYFLGDTYLTRRDFANAIKVLEIAMKLGDSYDRCVAQSLFDAYKLSGDYNAAIKLAETVLDDSENFGRRPWLSRLCDAYHAKEDYDGAVSALEGLIKRSGDFAEAGCSPLFKTYVAKFGYKDAIQKIERAFNETEIVLSPALAHDVLETYKTNRDYTGAATWFNNVVGSHPMDGWAWNGLANAYMEGGQYDEAIDTYRAAITQISVDYSFFLGLGDVYFAKHDDQKALDAYAQAIDRGHKAVTLMGIHL